MPELSTPRSPFRWGSLLSLCLLPACGVGDDADAAAAQGEAPEPLAGPVRPLPSPAGPGSGEPDLSIAEDGAVLSWLEEDPENEGRVRLRVARLGDGAWGEVHTVRSGEDFFVNWADFPSVLEMDGTLVGHWLQRGGSGGYDYGIRVVRSGDGGSSWSDPWTPHEDDTPTEHGFVSLFPDPAGGAGVVWLDGRRYAAGPNGTPATDEMTVRARSLHPDGSATEEQLLDPRACDCCQTDAVVTSEGPLVVYRDRSEAEIRDIYVTRRVDGAWEEGRPVHRDGWEIAACPVNGPAAAARGSAVAVAWFTAAGDEPRVRAAFSDDAGATFQAPIEIDDGSPAGRVDVVLLEDGSALVSWIERTGDAGNPDGAELRVRRVTPDGTRSRPVTVSRSSAARASGFPRMVLDGSTVIWAWTDVGAEPPRVRVASGDVARW